MGSFDHLRTQRTVALTTFRKDGTGVSTPVSVVVAGEHAYVRTWSTAGKAKRLRRDPHVLIAPSTVRGTPTGPAIEATARLLDADGSAIARKLLSEKHPLLHGVLVPWIHRLRGNTTIHYELSAAEPTSPNA